MVIFPQCLYCKNYIGRTKDGIHTCKAFPEGIPKEVFWNKIDHKNSIAGDNGILYEEDIC